MVKRDECGVRIAEKYELCTNDEMPYLPHQHILRGSRCSTKLSSSDTLSTKTLRSCTSNIRYATIIDFFEYTIIQLKKKQTSSKDNCLLLMFHCFFFLEHYLGQCQNCEVAWSKRKILRSGV